MSDNGFLVLRDVAVGYPDQPALIGPTRLELNPGELVALVGRNGSGKSTLLRTLAGLHPPRGGEILLNGRDVSRMDPRARARLVSFVNSGLHVLPSLRVRDLVGLGRLPYTGWSGRLGGEDRSRVEEVLRQTGLSDLSARKVDRLSDGERQRVFLARALVQDTPFVVLDEPGAFLDIPNKHDMIHLLMEFRDRGKTLLYSTHDLDMALSSCDRMWALLDGRVESGAPEDLGLTGVYDRLFARENMVFDSGERRFRWLGPVCGQVRLSSGDPRLHVWTLRALQRLGYEEGAGEAIPHIRVIGPIARPEWVVEKGGVEFRFDSIGGLARFLQREE